jgi:hypothetical protein
MTITVANTALTNTFEYLVNRSNELANAMSTKAVTTNSNTTAGNAAITGTFSANALTIGNSTVNTTFVSPNTIQISSGEYFLNANGDWTIATGPISNGSVTTVGTIAQIIDEFPASSIRGAEYALHVKNEVANGYQISKVLTVHTGAPGSAFSTEYGIVTSNGILATFSASVSGSNVVLSATPTVSNTTISYTRIRL